MTTKTPENNIPMVYVSDKIINSLPTVQMLLLMKEQVNLLLETKCTKLQKKILNSLLDYIDFYISYEKMVYTETSFLTLFSNDGKTKKEKQYDYSEDVDFE